MSIQPGPGGPGGAVERSQESTLADVINTILDKGIVVDVFARVSLVGIEILRIDARVVIASVDTYLRFAEAVDRLEMGAKEPSGLPETVGQITESATKALRARRRERLRALARSSERFSVRARRKTKRSRVANVRTDRQSQAGVPRAGARRRS